MIKMRSKLRKIFVILLLSGFLLTGISCVNHSLTSRTISKLQKGLDRETVISYHIDDRIEKEIVLKDFTGKDVKVDVYFKSMGENYGEFILCYVNGKLYYFGYPHEFAMHPDTFINDVGKKAMEIYNND